MNHMCLHYKDQVTTTVNIFNLVLQWASKVALLETSTPGLGIMPAFFRSQTPPSSTLLRGLESSVAFRPHAHAWNHGELCGKDAWAKTPCSDSADKPQLVCSPTDPIRLQETVETRKHNRHCPAKQSEHVMNSATLWWRNGLYAGSTELPSRLITGGNEWH